MRFNRDAVEARCYRLETKDTASQYCIALLTGVPFLGHKHANRFLIYLSLEVARENYTSWQFPDLFLYNK